MANTKGIRAGRAFVELFADDSRLVRGLRAAEAKIKAFGQRLTSAKQASEPRSGLRRAYV